MENKIKIKGARAHNLKNINLEVPKNELVVFCGVSGSGKSSLAFDTLFAEGQRRYVQSLSSYARQFLGMASKPDVDQIEGLSPAIAIDQKGLSHNPRSTVGTATEIYDYLRLLYAKVGHPICPKCGQEIKHQTPEEVAEQIYDRVVETVATEGKARFLILSPVVRDKRGEFSKLMDNLSRKGFEQVRIDGHFYSLDEDIYLIRTNRHNIQVVIDKISLTKKPDKKEFLKKITDAIELSFDLSQGWAVLAKVKDASFSFPEKPEETEDKLFSQQFACPDCQISLPPLKPRLFSFNSPLGACPACRGIGARLKADRSQVSARKAKNIEYRYMHTESQSLRKRLEKYMIKEACPDCQGSRLNENALSVLVDGKNVAQVSSLPLKELSTWLTALKNGNNNWQEQKIAKIIVQELENRVEFLLAVGVGYLTLDREATTLSAGEAQRIRLASQLGTGLTGVLYILDEPTIGLHPQDTDRLVKTLKKLRDLGNTVIVVEHDSLVLNQADHLVEFGPLAGQKGGKVVNSQSPEKLKDNSDSLTGKYLSGKKKVNIIGDRKEVDQDDKKISLMGCNQYNLKDITVQFPLKSFSVVAGVSGSGKSTLVTETLYPALKEEIYGRSLEKPGEYRSIKNADYLDRVLVVDQSPIGKTSRSNPATYVGVFNHIRKLFASTKEAKRRGFSKSHFSFNVDKGRCPNCDGKGYIDVKMEFLADVQVKCEECNGDRYKNKVLEIDYKGKNIADVLSMTIEEAEDFFSKHPKINSKLRLLREIGLGYLQVGQVSTTLSGGEAQRLKLARELVKHKRKDTIYLLDEPTTGLHAHDLEKLLNLLRKLVDRGNTIVVIEHHPEVIKQADWVVELGPEGGQNGGHLLFQGKPEQMKQSDKSVTARYL
jgi:excinuclease ABC subunit A